jgi:hypothetical protein
MPIITILSEEFSSFFAIVSFPVPPAEAGLESSTLRWWGDCSTTVLLPQVS